MIDYLIIPGGYLFGSISAAILVCRLMGLPDPRSEGSRNPGTTNVLRLGGKKAAILTLAGDMIKGLVPVLIAGTLSNDPMVMAGTALAAFLGHLYPVFFGFAGGKGVATALGVVFGLDWRVGLATVGSWLIMALIFRYSSLAALTAILLVPVGFWWQGAAQITVSAMLVMTILLYWRHRSNITNLLSGAETKIRLRKDSED